MPAYTRGEFMAEFDINETDIEEAGERINAYVQGWNLAQIRKDAGFTQEQLAQAMEVTQSRISAIENGVPESMSLSTIRTYIEALGGKLQIGAQFGHRQIHFSSTI